MHYGLLQREGLVVLVEMGVINFMKYLNSKSTTFSNGLKLFLYFERDCASFLLLVLQKS
jgi:hypothetical protein